MSLNKTPVLQDSLLSILNSARKLAHPERSNRNHIANVEWVLQMLLEGDMELQGLIPWSSNYTFLVSLTRSPDQANILGIYKPCAGERPLWDFPDGNLCHREFVGYLISQVLSWPNIPPTVLSDGPHGRGATQLFVKADYEAHYFNMRHISKFTAQFRQIALFDYVVNNADRKGGHCLKDKNNQLWAIDHGLTFHTDFKLRTVIWDFCEESIPTPLLKDLSHLQQLIVESSELWQILAQFISAQEIQALRQRIDSLLSSGCFPDLHPGYNMPYPPI